MLKFKLLGDILEVEEIWEGWIKPRISYFYYDVKNWKKSVTGKKDSPPILDMSENDIAWVKKYYLPKVKGGD